MSQYAVVVIGYNRTECIKKLYGSLLKADYMGDKVDLIFSLDHADDLSTKEYADSVDWPFGEKTVDYRATRMGLKSHILSVGKYLEKYEAIAVLEDDLIVSPAFYSYMRQTVPMYKDNPDVAGISLYSFERNVNSCNSFKADYSEYDVYFMMKAQSWGQIWIREKWNAFMEWYNTENIDGTVSGLDMPLHIKLWTNSWLKYHIAYCVANKQFFVYPYMPLTTCCAVKGEHTQNTVSIYQVRLYSGKPFSLRLPKTAGEAVQYDVYYERMNKLNDIMGIDEKSSLCVDLYNTKTVFDGYDYILTCRHIKGAELIKTYALETLPHESNVIFGIEGEGIYLYKLPDEKKDICFVEDSWQNIEYHLGMPIDFDTGMLKKYIRKLMLKYFKK